MRLIKNLVDRYKKHQNALAEKQKSEQEARAIENVRQDQKRAFLLKLVEYAEDGKITAEEIEDIEKQQKELFISEGFRSGE
jgi:cell fate (sporulation/competence/biofilm development) regulator YmcA (YheA/YmcA/DUF963 family)